MLCLDEVDRNVMQFSAVLFDRRGAAVEHAAIAQPTVIFR
jgi:hypothetical protein